MENSTERKILFVINPKSNKNAEKEIKDVLSKLEKDFRLKWDIYVTKGQNDIQNIKKLRESFKPDTIVAAGGDGTVNQVASILQNSDTKMGIISEGSANGLAFNLDIPNNTKSAIKKILTSEARSIDIIKINEKYNCLHLSDVGINARIVNRFEKEGDRGLIGYAKQMFNELFSGKTAFSFQLKTDNIQSTYPAEMLVIANAKSYGTGAVINPKGRIDDGKFELVIIRPYPWWIMFSFLPMFFTGKLHKLKYVKIISSSKAKIKLDKPHDLQVDGEAFSDVQNLDIRILKHAIKVHY